jgi:hypothetical protein
MLVEPRSPRVRLALVKLIARSVEDYTLPRNRVADTIYLDAT